MDLKDKRVLITGGTPGMGIATALARDKRPALLQQADLVDGLLIVTSSGYKGSVLAARLAVDMAACNLNISDFSRRLVGDSSVTQSDQRLKVKRRQIQEWLTPSDSVSHVKWMHRKSARAVAAALGTDSARYMRPEPSPEERMLVELEWHEAAAVRLRESLRPLRGATAPQR